MSKEPLFIDGPAVLVSREWFDRVMSDWDARRSGCPFCGSTAAPVRDEKPGFYARLGCGVCNRWWSEPELDGRQTT